MDQNQTKKDMINQYKDREITGGIYAIKNTETGKMLIEATTDLRGRQNRFEFSQKTGTCVYVKLRDDWNKQKGEQFILEVLEELKKGESQSMEDFKADIEILLEMWLEKLAGSDLY